MSQTKNFAVRSVVVIASAVAMFLATQGCGAECVDRFDCRDKATKGQTLTCNAGKCVNDTSAMTPDSGR